MMVPKLFSLLILAGTLIFFSSEITQIGNLIKMEQKSTRDFYFTIGCGRYLVGLKNLDAARQIIAVETASEHAAREAYEKAITSWNLRQSRWAESCSKSTDPYVFYHENSKKSLAHPQPNWAFYLTAKQVESRL